LQDPALHWQFAPQLHDELPHPLVAVSPAGAVVENMIDDERRSYA